MYFNHKELCSYVLPFLLTLHALLISPKPLFYFHDFCDSLSLIRLSCTSVGVSLFTWRLGNLLVTISLKKMTLLSATI